MPISYRWEELLEEEEAESEREEENEENMRRTCNNCDNNKRLHKCSVEMMIRKSQHCPDWREVMKRKITEARGGA